MHYKNLAFAALAGIVLLSSCVKDLETKSVTDIRNAKLEEIKSQTALNNAKAASEKTLSEAEALLKAAQAEAQKAQAEYIKAQAAYQQALTEGALMKNQLLAAQLEAALIKAEIQKEKAQAELERLAMELEKKLLEAQKELLEAQAEYKSGLATAYVSATSTLLEAQGELVKLKGELIKAENGLVDLQTSKEALIALNNEKIASLEKVVAAYHEGMTEEEVAAKKDELNLLLNEKLAEEISANEAYSASETKLKEDRPAVDEYFIHNVGAHKDYFSFNGGAGDYKRIVKVYPNAEGEYSFWYKDSEGKKVGTAFATKGEYEEEKPIVSYVDGKEVTLPYPDGLRTYEKAKVLDTKAPETVATDIKAIIAEKHEDSVAETQTNINQYTALVAAYEKAVSEYEAKTKDFYNEKEELEEKLEKAYAAADKAEIPYVEYLTVHDTEYYAAWRALDKAKAEKEEIENQIPEKKTSIETKSKDIEGDYENGNWGLVDRVAYYTGLVKDKEAAVKTATDELEKAQTAYDTQAAVVAPLQEKYDVAFAKEREAYLGWMAGTVSYEDYLKAIEATTDAKGKLLGPKNKLEELEGILAGCQDDLDGCKLSLIDSQTWKTYYEETLSQARKDLETYKSELAQLESNLTDAEKAVKAAEEAEEAARAKVDETSEEFLALEKAVEEAYAECEKLEDSIEEVEGKIDEIEGTDEVPGMELEIAYSYDDLCEGRLINGYVYIDRYSDALWYLSSYEESVEDYSNELADDKASFDDFNKQVDEWVEKVTGIFASETSYSADVDALNELEKATLELYKKYKAAKEAKEDVNAQITAFGAKDYEIETYKNEIKSLKEANAKIVTDITTYEDQIAALKLKIASYEAEIEAYKKNVEEAKAALDAALAEENTTEE